MAKGSRTRRCAWASKGRRNIMMILILKMILLLIPEAISMCTGDLLGNRFISEDPLHGGVRRRGATEGCDGVNNKTSPPGRHQEQASKQRCTFSSTTFSSVQFSSVLQSKFSPVQSSVLHGVHHFDDRAGRPPLCIAKGSLTRAWSTCSWRG